MAIVVRKYFNVDLPAALTANAAAARAIGARYQFLIGGPDGGEWFVDLTSSGPSCKPGRGPGDCTVSLSDGSFRTLCENPNVNAVSLFMAGQIKVLGNTAIAMKLGNVLSFVALPKAPTPPAPAPPPATASPQPAPPAPVPPRATDSRPMTPAAQAAPKPPPKPPTTG